MSERNERPLGTGEPLARAGAERQRGAGISERTFPAPSTVSEQAQEWLAFDVGELPFPAIEDTDAWLAMVEQANRSTAQRFPISEPPVTVEDLDVDGATVYAARPHNGRYLGEDVRKKWRTDLDPQIQVVREIAREYGAHLLAADGMFAELAATTGPEYWAADGVHPTPAGHTALAASWLRLVA